MDNPQGTDDPRQVSIHPDVRDDLMALAKVLRRDHRDILKDAVEAFRVGLTNPPKKPGRKPQS